MIRKASPVQREHYSIAAVLLYCSCTAGQTIGERRASSSVLSIELVSSKISQLSNKSSEPLEFFYHFSSPGHARALDVVFARQYRTGTIHYDTNPVHWFESLKYKVTPSESVTN